MACLRPRSPARPGNTRPTNRPQGRSLTEACRGIGDRRRGIRRQNVKCSLRRHKIGLGVERTCALFQRRAGLGVLEGRRQERGYIPIPGVRESALTISFIYIYIYLYIPFNIRLHVSNFDIPWSPFLCPIYIDQSSTRACCRRVRSTSFSYTRSTICRGTCRVLHTRGVPEVESPWELAEHITLAQNRDNISITISRFQVLLAASKLVLLLQYPSQLLLHKLHAVTAIAIFTRPLPL